MHDQKRRAATESFVTGLDHLFWIAGSVALVGALLAFTPIRQSGVDIHRSTSQSRPPGRSATPEDGGERRTR